MKSEFLISPPLLGHKKGSGGATDEVCPSTAAEHPEGTKFMDIPGPHESLEVGVGGGDDSNKKKPSIINSKSVFFQSWARERQLNEESVLSYDARSRLLFQAKDRLFFVPL